MVNSTNVSTNASKIVAPSSRQALRLIREQLGPDAIILSNRVTPAGVEIVAIAEDAATRVSASAQPLVASSVEASTNVVPPQMTVSQRPATESVIGEIHSMRNMIEEQLAGLLWNEKQKRDPVRGPLLRTLLSAGFSGQLAKSMLDQLPPGHDYTSGMAWVKAELTRTVPVLENEDAMMDGGGVYALMGPTGVGKTTTTAKLAARCVTRFGAEKLALLTTDSYRIGAYEQLRIYGQIMGISVHAVSDAVDLRLVLDDLHDKHLVLIDTIGMSQRDRTVSEQVAMLCGIARPVKRLLLLNATSHGDTLNEVVHAYRHAGAEAGGNGLAGCIFTKLDEATHPGALLDTVIRHRLPVHYISSGQKVPENLTLADPAQLIDSVFRAGSRTGLFVPMMVDLAERAPAMHDAEKAASKAAMEQLRTQSHRLIQALGHDVPQLRTVAANLSKAGIGFDAARTLWRHLTHDATRTDTVVQALLAHAQAEIGVGCRDYVLAVQSKTDFGSGNNSDSNTLYSSLLLSDCSGAPLAAPNQMLMTALAASTDGAAGTLDREEMRQLDWLQQQAFGKPVMHLLESVPAPALIREWQAAGVQWMARARAATLIATEGDAGSTLAKLAGELDFSAPEKMVYKGKPALQSVAEAPVRLRTRVKGESDTLNESAPVLRCVVTRIVDSQSGKPLAQWYLLTNASIRMGAQLVAKWHYWKLTAATYPTLLKQGMDQLGGCDEPHNIDMQKRLLIAGQGCVTVWLLQHEAPGWADAACSLLARLSGLPVRPGKPVAGTVLLAGLSRLYALLDALDDGGVSPLEQAPHMAAA